MTHVDPFLSTTGAGLTCETDSLKVLCVLESGIFPLPLLPLGNWRCDYVRWCVCLCVSLNIITANNKARRRRQGELWPETLSPACVCVCVCVCVSVLCKHSSVWCVWGWTQCARSQQQIEPYLNRRSTVCSYTPFLSSVNITLTSFLSVLFCLRLSFVHPFLSLVCLLST